MKIDMSLGVHGAGKGELDRIDGAARMVAAKAASQTRIDREIGAVLRRIRLGAGLSQQAVARLVGTSFQQVQKYERGVNRIPLSRLILLCEALGVTVLDVVSEVVSNSGGPSGDTAELAEHAANTRLGARAMAAVARVEDPELLEAVIRLLDSVSRDRKQDAAEAAQPRLPAGRRDRGRAGPARAAPMQVDFRDE